MGWKVEFVPGAAKEFRELSIDLKKKFEYLFLNMETSGIHQLSGKRSKYLEDGLWELRVTGNDNIARSIYAVESGNMFKMLLVFVKKTQKTPRELIDLAHKRRRESNETH